ncbi:hypothetical protein [uncultured Roseibium sp.]|uniref:YciI family protein n=1 Tax=uncultured Roseibium sp. TaxID=1936171 RepID=UPI002592A132|nr:hypothetical protein [uncultured Roseibium sp.]
MFIVVLKFAENKTAAPHFMEQHKAWIQKGFDDGAFLLVGSLKPNGGGMVLARGSDRDALQARIDQDPFVVEKVVSAEVTEVAPNMADDSLAFLVA